MEIKLRRFFVTLVVALILFLAAMGIISLFWLVPSPGYLTFGRAREPIHIGLNLNLNLPSLTVNDSPKIEITELDYQVIDKLNAETICFDSILVADTFFYTHFGGKDLGIFTTDNLLEESLPLCFNIGSDEPGKNFHTIDLRNTSSFSEIFTAGPNNYWYPFDNYTFDFAIQASLHLVNIDGTISRIKTTPTRLLITSSDEVNWNTTITTKEFLIDTESENLFPLA